MERKSQEQCPDRTLLHAYLENRLFGSHNVSILEHIKYCSPCLWQLASLQARAKIKPAEKAPAPRYPSLVS